MDTSSGRTRRGFSCSCVPVGVLCGVCKGPTLISAISPRSRGLFGQVHPQAQRRAVRSGCLKAAVSSAAVLLAPPAFSFPASAWCVLCPPSRFGARGAFLGPAMSHPGLVMLPVPSQGSRSVLSLLSTPPAHRRASLSLRILPCRGVSCHILLHEAVSLCHHSLI